MSTRGFVSQRSNNGTASAVYVHSDAYPADLLGALSILSRSLGSPARAVEAILAEPCGWSDLRPSGSPATNAPGQRVVPGVGIAYTSGPGRFDPDSASLSGLQFGIDVDLAFGTVAVLRVHRGEWSHVGSLPLADVADPEFRLPRWVGDLG